MANNIWYRSLSTAHIESPYQSGYASVKSSPCPTQTSVSENNQGLWLACVPGPPRASGAMFLVGSQGPRQIKHPPSITSLASTVWGRECEKLHVGSRRLPPSSDRDWVFSHFRTRRNGNMWWRILMTNTKSMTWPCLPLQAYFRSLPTSCFH